ncbi:DUF7521 family protein [Halorhabdus amylolytica]|uniref:DUF7521 family protein n=1 Tax=Halorhabdus amylolytica TaxID=2559573 RepID=UPI0010AAE568|nr:hypothetical protein [Halorhabdus amylolytica]
MQSSVVIVTAAEMIVLGCTGILAYLAFRAYRRTGSPSLCTLMIGLALVALGSLLGGALHQFGAFSFDASVGIDSAFTALGFVVVLYALYADNAREGFSP